MIWYVDGACSGNGGINSKGGYGVIGVSDETPIHAHSHFVEGTTNNKEELKAILYVMINYGVNIKNEDWIEIPVVYSDSAYSVNTLNDWMFKWAKNGWIKSDKKTPENLDLIQAYYDLYQQGYRIDLRKIKGHSGQKWNEVADKLATGVLTPEAAMEVRY